MPFLFPVLNFFLLFASSSGHSPPCPARIITPGKMFPFATFCLFLKPSLSGFYKKNVIPPTEWLILKKFFLNMQKICQIYPLKTINRLLSQKEPWIRGTCPGTSLIIVTRDEFSGFFSGETKFVANRPSDSFRSPAVSVRVYGICHLLVENPVVQ